MRRQEGQALLTVLVVMMVLHMFGWAYLARMNSEQHLAGTSARGIAALYLAEAGLHTALLMLEEQSTGTSPGGVRSLPYHESLGSGTFTIEEIRHLPVGLIEIIVRGESAGAHRRVRSLARIGPEALAHAAYGERVVTLGGRARTYLVPHRTGTCRCAGGLAVGGELQLDTRAALNSFGGFPVILRGATVSDLELPGAPTERGTHAGLADLVLSPRARLTMLSSSNPVSADDLRRLVKELGIRSVRRRAPFSAVNIDLDRLKAMAEGNKENAAINATVGTLTGESGLRAKANSRYTAEEFGAVIAFLQGRTDRALRGIVVVEGDVYLDEGITLTVLDGAVVVEGDVEVARGARLVVQHSIHARTLPGLIAWMRGTIQISAGGVAVIDGLVLADQAITLHGGALSVTGAVASRNLSNVDGTLVVLYDSRVLVVEGLRAGRRGIAEIVSWQELP